MVRPLEYRTELSLKEAEDRYREIRGEFRSVKSRYSGWFRKPSGNMNEGDQRTLGDCVGVLLPLGNVRSVQDQAAHSRRIRGTLHEKIGRLNFEILGYLANFDNTGVTRI